MLSRVDLQAIDLFESLNEDQLDQILDRHRESSHQADQVIVMEQDWGDSLFVLCEGLAKVRIYAATGDEVVMSLLGAGDVFGEMAAIDGGTRSADVVALTPLRLVKLRTADATTRLLDSLAYLARKSSAQNDPQASIPPLAQLEIALIAGLARETASRTLSKLRTRGTVIEDNGRLRLVNLKPLVKRGLMD